MGVLNNPKLRWILRSGWAGTCPRCGKGHMFRGWLKLRERCEVCGLDYSYARTDDGPAFFALCLTALPLVFVVVWVQVRFDPPWWVHLLTSVPVLAFGCIATLRPFKGWLAASQYVNHAVEAGTEGLWAKLDARDAPPPGGDRP